MTNPTQRQLDVLQFVADFTAENGFAPSMRDICDGLGFAAHNAAADHLKALRRKQLIRWKPLTARSYVLTEYGRSWIHA